MQIEYRRLSALRENAHNSRTHSPRQIEQIAASMQEFGWTNPILIDENDEIIAGHGRREAALFRGETEGPCVVLEGLSEAQKRAYLIADNQLPLNAGWNLGALKAEIEALQDLDFNIEVLGFDSSFLDSLLADIIPAEDPQAIPPPPTDPVTVDGDMWMLDGHRVMCGDSTSVDAVATLVGNERGTLLHADPPYGMGKQSAGVENDNLYREKLDEFQMEWWATWRTFLTDNASAYVWGNAPDLWRLWYQGGLGDSEEFELRNEIVWDKKTIPGMASDLMTQYPEASERCLFFQFGPQFLGNVNADQYWPGWDEIRLYLEGEAVRAALNPSRCREITGVQMFAHWFSKSQWAMISDKYYTMLQAGLPGYFERPYADLRRTYDRIKGGYRNHVNGIRGGHAVVLRQRPRRNARRVGVWSRGRRRSPRPCHPQTRRNDGTRDEVEPAPRRALSGAVWRFRLDANGRRAHRPALLYDGDHPRVRRRDRAPLAELYGQKGRARSDGAAVQ